MSRIYSIRKGNLRRLAEEHGGAASLSKLLGYANGSRLSQLIGTGITEDIPEKVARSIEQTLSLSERFLDEDRGSSETDSTGTQVGVAIRDLLAELGDDELSRMTEDRFGEICALALHECRAHGKADSKFIKRLIRIIGPQ